MGYSESLDWYCGQKDYLVTSNNVHWTIVGEFARKWRQAGSGKLIILAANTDCAYWLNGRGMGVRYDNTLNTSASWVHIDPLCREIPTEESIGSDILATAAVKRVRILASFLPSMSSI